ncbi:carboxypeptidase-like regulatory domain-containing protein [Algibacter aquimarinus]|uniref:CarboxypepD_reg-like domain-containing protein n=1 Tax=Algibacter aquimarinus TaxID=1136748 RepID=A0ABP9HJI6_9FLAO
MKHIIYIVIFFISAFSYAQDFGSISGKLLDLESSNEPLMFAKVLIKETGNEVLSDENGVFKFENIESGEYTLVCSFVGYETKASKIKVESNKLTTLKLPLKASTLSLDDLFVTLASVDNAETSSAAND